MAYPESSDVTAGQPTAYQHYNNLRADALRFGAAAADGANLGSLLAAYHENLTLQYLATNRVRVPASASAPVSLVIGGVPLTAVDHVDLPAGAVPSGAAAIWYVFAVRSPGSTAFTLDINTSPTETVTARRIGSFYWNGSAIAAGTIQADYAATLEAQAPHWYPFVANGRLTLTSGTPVTTADVTGAGTVYFTPYRGYQVALFSPCGWFVYEFSELSISLAGKASGSNHDIFIYDAGAGLALTAVEWSSDTTRATALAMQDGVLVRSGATYQRYLGTVRTIGAGVTEDSVLNRLVWNANNRLPRRLHAHDATSNWTGPNSWRMWNNTASHHFKVVFGLEEDVMQVNFVCKAGGGGVPGLAIAVDSSSPTWGAGNVSSDSQTEFLYANYSGHPGIGFHTFNLLEYADGALLYGQNNRRYSGAAGWVMA